MPAPDAAPHPVRGRFAPSPTGQLHLGNARTALLAWGQVRSASGAFVLRMEDLDHGRVRPGYAEQQMEDLRWLGLDWDEGPDVGGPDPPYHQSGRTAAYSEALRALARVGSVYSCTCTRREIAAAALAAVSAPNGPEDEGPRYPGNCAAAGRPDRDASLRFRVPSGTVEFQDAVCGLMRVDPAEAAGDFVVRRKDGIAAYQLAVVVDDAAMRISHVLRGADLLASTARQLLLGRALGLPPPRVWAHVPLLLGADGQRLAKRHGAVSLGELRRAGVPAERVVGWLAATCNLARPNEPLSAADFAQRFTLAALPSGPTTVTPSEVARLFAG